MITSTLGLVLLYLVAAVAGVVVCRLAKLPPMLGYLAVGVLIGPNATALAKDTARITYLAEFGSPGTTISSWASCNGRR